MVLEKIAYLAAIGSFPAAGFIVYKMARSREKIMHRAGMVGLSAFCGISVGFILAVIIPGS